MTRFAIDITFQTGEHGELVINADETLQAREARGRMEPGWQLALYDTREEAEAVAADVFHGSNFADVEVYTYED